MLSGFHLSCLTLWQLIHRALLPAQFRLHTSILHVKTVAKAHGTAKYIWHRFCFDKNGIRLLHWVRRSF